MIRACWPPEHEVLGHRGAGVGGDVLQRGRSAGAGDDHRRVVHRAVSRGASRSRRRRSIPSGRWRRRSTSRRSRVWLMIVSMPMAVLPVLRSPMISSRWPRPMGVIASMALMPVCSGSLTGCRSATPGAMISTGRRSVGDDRALAVERVAQRIDHAAEHGRRRPARSSSRPVLRTSSPSVIVQVVAEDDDADRVLFEVEGQADRAVGELDHLAGHHAGQAVDAGDAVADLEHAADLADVDLRRELLDFLLDDGSDFVALNFIAILRYVLADTEFCRGSGLTRGRASPLNVVSTGCSMNRSGLVSIMSVARSIIALRASFELRVRPSRRTRGRRRARRCRRSATDRRSRSASGSRAAAIAAAGRRISLRRSSSSARGHANLDVGHARAARRTASSTMP